MLKIYNTMTKAVEEFRPLEDNKVRMYSCGPTVYDYAHIGNLRAYTFVDLLKRYLKYSGYEVTHVMNITDVDDKTIKRSQQQGRSLKEFTDFYYNEFLKNIDSLNIQRPDVMPKATDHIPEMVGMIKELLKNDFAYKLEGSTYYAISKFPHYGELAGLENVNAGDMKVGKSDEYKKEDVRDFALWKGWDEADGDVAWETELGKGRPGWHIECSAMSTKYLGNSFDIHCGGIDLVFPHHTNEIAQTEAVTGEPFVKYWLHNEHLLVEGEKMSKSLNNFITLKNLMDEGINPLLVRIQLIKAHYRQRLNFTRAGIEEAKAISDKIVRAVRLLDSITNTKENKLDVEGFIETNESGFVDAMDNDLNISEGMSSLFEVIDFAEKNKDTLNEVQAKQLKAYMFKLDSVFGFVESLYQQYLQKLEIANKDPEITDLIQQREKLRKEGDYARSDEIRDLLKTKGYEVKDTKNGSVLDLINIF